MGEEISFSNDWIYTNHDLSSEENILYNFTVSNFKSKITIHRLRLSTNRPIFWCPQKTGNAYRLGHETSIEKNSSRTARGQESMAGGVCNISESSLSKYVFTTFAMWGRALSCWGVIRLLKQELTIGPMSIQRWIPTSDCQRTVGTITMYWVRTTPVSNVVPILLTNIFSSLAVNIFQILIKYFYCQIHVLRVKTYFKEDYQCRINSVHTLLFYKVNFQGRLNTGWTLYIYCRKITFSTVGRRLGLLYTQPCTNAGI